MTAREALAARSPDAAQDGVRLSARAVAAALDSGADPAGVARELRHALATAPAHAGGFAAAVDAASALMLEGIALSCDGLATRVGMALADEELLEALAAVDDLVAGDLAAASGAFAAVAADALASPEASPFFPQALPPGTSTELRGWATGCALLRNAR